MTLDLAGETLRPLAAKGDARPPSSKSARTKDPSAPRQVIPDAHLAHERTHHLEGARLRWLQVSWLVAALATVACFVIALPNRYAELLRLFKDITPAQQLILADLGITGAQHARLVFSVEIVVAGVFFAVGLLIFWRRPDDWVAMSIALGLMGYVAWISPALPSLMKAQPDWRLPVSLVQIMGMLTTVCAFFLFPNGRFVPRWSALVVVGSGLWAAGWLIFPGSVFDMGEPYRLSLTTFGLTIIWWIIGIGAQVYRYTREMAPVQRRQTKLVVAALTIGVIAWLVFGFDRFALPVLAEPQRASVVYDLVGVPIFLVVSLVIPLSFAASILRYRLWEIDVIVNRALTYGALTAIVAGLFPASMAICEKLFIAMTGEKSDVATVVTTLFFAAMLTPLKDCLERLIDRSIRPALNPMDRLHSFSDRVRSVVELLDVEEVTRRAVDEAVAGYTATGGAAYLLGNQYPWPAHARGNGQLGNGMTVWLDCEGVEYGWITIGPRRDGREYSHHDYETLVHAVSPVARAIHLAQTRGPTTSADMAPVESRLGGSQ